MQLKSLDCVLLNVPGTLGKGIHAAPALLKANLLRHGFTCKVMDFNIRFKRDSEHRPDFTDFENFFLTGETDHDTVVDAANELIGTYAKELATLVPKMVAVSVFTYQSRTAAVMFAKAIRHCSPLSKIVFGGQGLSTGINGDMTFAQNLLDTGVIDYFIKSEGEIALLKILQGVTQWPGVNDTKFDQLKEIDDLPAPDYEDLDFSLYDKPVRLPITGSRGCVRRCTFCDIHQHWKYAYRHGENIANEIIYLSQKYRHNCFQFTDSLVNGNQREFKRMLTCLAQYNEQSSDPVSWTGQYIVHPMDKDQPHSYWKALKQSGAEELILGIESGSEKIRQDMRKPFSDYDLEHTMEMFDRHSITCGFLLMFGYPTETQHDFELTMAMLDKYKNLSGRTILWLEFGSTLAILPGTPLYGMSDELALYLDQHENNWISDLNPSLTLRERIRRRNHAQTHAIAMGYSCLTDMNDRFIESYLSKNIDRFENRLRLQKKFKILPA